MPTIEDAAQQTAKDPSALAIQIEQTSTQTDPTRTLPIEFDIVFSKKIKESSFNVSKIINIGTASGVNWQLVETKDRSEFRLKAISLTGDGTVIPFIANSTVQDIFGISNVDSSSVDASVLYDSLRPNLSINQRPAQLDPSNTLPISFDVVFSEPIKTNSFTASDINNLGTASNVQWSITDSGDHKNFLLQAIGLGSAGTIIPNVQSILVEDLVGNLNYASTATDNNVLYDNTPPTLTINQASGQLDPTASLPIEFDVIFSEAISAASFTVADITNTGSASVLLWNIIQVDSLNYIIRAASIVGDGSIEPSIAIGQISDLAGNTNTAASTSSDNSVTYDTAAPAAPSIAGVTGVGDSVQNNLLSSGAGNDIASIHWADISGETEYKIAIYESDGTTLKCAEVSKVANSTNHTFSTCSLTQGKEYKVKLSAHDAAANTSNASNNMFAFLYAPDLTIADSTQDENHASGKIGFTLSLNVASDWSTSIAYATADNTALVAGTFNDYVAASGTLNIPAGNLNAPVDVSLIDGAYDEPDNQSFYLNLTSPVNANLSDSQAIGTINDNDAPPTISIANVEAFEAGPNLEFIATLSLASEKTIQYSWTTSDATAVTSVDFTGGSGGPISIAAGNTTSALNIATIDNTTACQIDRDFTISLSALTNVTAGAQTTATGLIKEDDFPQILAQETEVLEGEKAKVN